MSYVGKWFAIDCYVNNIVEHKSKLLNNSSKGKNSEVHKMCIFEELVKHQYDEKKQHKNWSKNEESTKVFITPDFEIPVEERQWIVQYNIAIH